MRPLIENLLKVEATDHRKIQEEIKSNLRNLGYYVKLEKKIWFRKEGKIDIFAQKGSFFVGEGLLFLFNMIIGVGKTYIKALNFLTED